jgi:hypothetical protein
LPSTVFDPANRACPASLSLQAIYAAQQVALVQQSVDSSPPNPSSIRSLNIRRNPSPVLRRSCSSVYLVAPPLLYHVPPPPGRPSLSRRPVLQHSVQPSLLCRPRLAAAAPAAPCRTCSTGQPPPAAQAWLSSTASRCAGCAGLRSCPHAQHSCRMYLNLTDQRVQLTDISCSQSRTCRIINLL